MCSSKSFVSKRVCSYNISISGILPLGGLNDPKYDFISSGSEESPVPGISLFMHYSSYVL